MTVEREKARNALKRHIVTLDRLAFEPTRKHERVETGGWNR